MIHPWAFLYTEIGTLQEQPLPWNASEVHVTFSDDSDLLCQVTRCPGDLLRIGTGEVPARPAGTGAQLQWTQRNRGGYAVGTVVDPPSADGPGLYIRVDESIAGVERRLGERLRVQVPAIVTAPSGEVTTGLTADLSPAGTCIAVDQVACRDLLRDLVRPTSGARHPAISVTLTLPTGVISVGCAIISVDARAGRIRIRFTAQDALVRERIAAFCATTQQVTISGGTGAMHE